MSPQVPEGGCARDPSAGHPVSSRSEGGASRAPRRMQNLFLSCFNVAKLTLAKPPNQSRSAGFALGSGLRPSRPAFGCDRNQHFHAQPLGMPATKGQSRRRLSRWCRCQRLCSVVAPFADRQCAASCVCCRKRPQAADPWRRRLQPQNARLWRRAAAQAARRRRMSRRAQAVHSRPRIGRSACMQMVRGVRLSLSLAGGQTGRLGSP